MALVTIQMQSATLGKCVTVRVLAPDQARPPFATYYLLHGLSDDEPSWTRNTRLEYYPEAQSFLIVMPDGVRSFYCDSVLGDYESYLVRNLVPWIDTMFPTRADAAHRVVGGLPMGGYDAAKLALKFPDVFGMALSHSGALGVMRRGDMRFREPEAPADLRAFFQSVAATENDPFRLAADLAPDRRPALYFDCGREDFLFKDNEAFHAHLDDLDYPHDYRRYPGAHTWDYWDARIRDALAAAAAFVGDA